MTSTTCKSNYAVTVKHILPYPRDPPRRCAFRAADQTRVHRQRYDVVPATRPDPQKCAVFGRWEDRGGVLAACWGQPSDPCGCCPCLGSSRALDRRSHVRHNAFNTSAYPGGHHVARDPPDEKLSALRAHHALNPRPHLVSDAAFTAGHPFFDARDLVQVKYEMLRRVQTEGYPVAQAARAFGFSRPSFYATQRAWQQGGLQGLVPARPGPRRAHKLREEVVLFVEQTVAADPTVRAPQLAELVAERFAVVVHPRSIERALARRGVRHTDPPSRPAQPGTTPPV